MSDGLFTPSLIDALRADCCARWRDGAFHEAGVGRGDGRRIHRGLRNDFTLWLNPAELTSAQRRYLDLMEVFRLHVNQELYLGLFEYEAQFALYPPGHFYRKHLDAFHGASGRIVSCVLYLNSSWVDGDGGALRLYLEDRQPATSIDILPRGGRFVTFLSDRFYHEVLPSCRERLSLTGWFTARNLAGHAISTIA